MFTPINTTSAMLPHRIDPGTEETQSPPSLPPQPRTFFYLLTRIEYTVHLHQTPLTFIASKALYRSKLLAHTALAADSKGKVALRLPVPGLREQEECWYATPTYSEDVWLFWVIQDVPLVDEGGEGQEEGRYAEGFEDGYGEGYEGGYDGGYDEGYDEGYADGYGDGFDEGYGEVFGYESEGESEGETACEGDGEKPSGDGYVAIPEEKQGDGDEGDDEWETCDEA